MNTEKPLTYLLGQTMHLVKQKLMARFRENNIDLSLEHFVILHQISQKEDLTQQDLANELQRDKSIILRQINTLIEWRYVVRLQDKDDKRKKNLILTKKGYDTLMYSKQIAHEVSAELLQGIAPEDFVVFENVVKRIQSNTGYQFCDKGC